MRHVLFLLCIFCSTLSFSKEDIRYEAMKLASQHFNVTKDHDIKILGTEYHFMLNALKQIRKDFPVLKNVRDSYVDVGMFQSFKFELSSRSSTENDFNDFNGLVESLVSGCGSKTLTETSYLSNRGSLVTSVQTTYFFKDQVFRDSKNCNHPEIINLARDLKLESIQVTKKKKYTETLEVELKSSVIRDMEYIRSQILEADKELAKLITFTKESKKLDLSLSGTKSKISLNQSDGLGDYNKPVQISFNAKWGTSGCSSCQGEHNWIIEVRKVGGSILNPLDFQFETQLVSQSGPGLPENFKP